MKKLPHRNTKQDCYSVPLDFDLRGTGESVNYRELFTKEKAAVVLATSKILRCMPEDVGEVLNKKFNDAFHCPNSHILAIFVFVIGISGIRLTPQKKIYAFTSRNQERGIGYFPNPATLLEEWHGVRLVQSREDDSYLGEMSDVANFRDLFYTKKPPLCVGSGDLEWLSSENLYVISRYWWHRALDRHNQQVRRNIANVDTSLKLQE
jgi:hypothetical protein